MKKALIITLAMGVGNLPRAHLCWLGEKKCWALYKTQRKLCKPQINTMENKYTMNLLHKCLGHLREKGMHLLAKKELISIIKRIYRHPILVRPIGGFRLKNDPIIELVRLWPHRIYKLELINILQ